MAICAAGVIEGRDVMQIHILEDAGQELAAIDSAIRGRDAEIRRVRPVGPIERLYTFAGMEPR